MAPAGSGNDLSRSVTTRPLKLKYRNMPLMSEANGRRRDRQPPARATDHRGKERVEPAAGFRRNISMLRVISLEQAYRDLQGQLKMITICGLTSTFRGGSVGQTRLEHFRGESAILL